LCRIERLGGWGDIENGFPRASAPNFALARPAELDFAFNVLFKEVISAPPRLCAKILFSGFNACRFSKYA